MKSKLFSLIASIVAGTVLGGALVYYNFIEKPAPEGAEVGDVCPDFTVDTLKIENGQFVGSGGAISFEAVRALNPKKVMVINFWATGCGACIAELPDFNRFQEEYSDDVMVFALDGERSYTAETLSTWINTRYAEWTGYSLTFGKYDEGVYDVLVDGLGFSGDGLPATMIVDTDGKVAYKTEGSLHYADLEEIILPLID